MFANQATLALERAQAQRDRSVIAVLADRDRIARDLHDLVIQRLFATGLQLQGMHRMVKPEAQDRISRAVEDIDATIRDLRAAIFELHHQPDQSSLRADVQALVAEYAEPLGFRPRLDLHRPPDTAVPRRRSAADSRRDPGITVQCRSARPSNRGRRRGHRSRRRSHRPGLRRRHRNRLRPPTGRAVCAISRQRAEALGGAVRLSSNEPHGTVLELRAPITASPS